MKTFRNRLISHNRMLILIFLAIYIVIFAMGNTALIFSFLYPHHDNKRQPFTEKLAQDYLDKNFSYIKGLEAPNMAIAIYDKEGAVFLTVEPSNKIDAVDVSSAGQCCVSDVLQGSSVYRPVMLSDPDSLLPMIVSVDGAPIRDGTGIAGAVFIIKVLPQLPTALFSFACYYTVLYWIAAGCLLLTARYIRRTNQIQQAYIANVTHSLKSPIASVRSVTETLSDVPDLDEEHKMGYYGIILQEMNALNHLVCQMLELSRQQSGQIHYEMTTTSFDEVFGPVIEKYKMLCECTQVTLIVSDELASLPALYTNIEAARAVMEILLENASKYTSSGNTIQISAAASRRKVTFCVRNNGGAIPPEDVPYIFERFYKGKNSTFSSSGLGLAIARETAENLHEKIWVKCIQPDETMFYFTVSIPPWKSGKVSL